MLHRKLVAICLIAAPIGAFPLLSSPAKAQDPGRILGPLTAPLRSLLRPPRIGVPRFRRSRATNRRPSATRERAAEARQASPGAFWPNASPTAYEDMVGYALWPREYGRRFWSHGPRDIVLAMMAPAAAFASDSRKNRRQRSRLVNTAQADEQSSEAETQCIERARQHTLQPIERVAETIDIDQAQRGKLDVLRTAVAAAVDREQAACRMNTPASPPERLRALIDGLWAMRYAEFGIRTALQDFYHSLNGPQKTALADDIQTVGSTAADGDGPADWCGAQDSAGTTILARFQRALRPTQEQQESLQMLHGASMEMAQFLMTTCPSETPSTPIARLDAAGDRVMALLHAAMNIEPLFNDFYSRLTDDQRRRLTPVTR